MLSELLRKGRSGATCAPCKHHWRNLIDISHYIKYENASQSHKTRSLWMRHTQRRYNNETVKTTTSAVGVFVLFYALKGWLNMLASPQTDKFHTIWWSRCKSLRKNGQVCSCFIMVYIRAVKIVQKWQLNIRSKKNTEVRTIWISIFAHYVHDTVS